VRWAVLLAAGVLALVGCSAASPAAQRTLKPASELRDVPPATLTQLASEEIEGQWYVKLSNYGFWERRSRTSPSFSYRLRADSDELVMLDDHVAFEQRGRPRTFDGVDLQDPTLAGHFQWRGHGSLYGVVNHWYVVGLDPAGEWMVIYFPPSSLGTSAGLEVITRDEDPPKSTLDTARAYIDADADLRERATGLAPVRR
jgi:hypothetical protein